MLVLSSGRQVDKYI